jgi:hypothetical protein
LPAAVTEVRANLVAWLERAAGAYSSETERSFRTVCLAFGNWCEARKLSPLPAIADTVAAWLRDGAAGGWRTDKAGNPQPVAVATLRQRAAMVARLHRAASLPDPCKSEPVRLALRAIAREHGTQQHQARPLVERDADRIVAHVAAFSLARR